MATKRSESPEDGDLQHLGTRDRILAVARRLVDDDGEAAATMKAVAKLAGVSRQAVYLHFPDRSQLLSALSDHIDKELGLGDWMAKIEALETAADKLRLLAITRSQRSSALAPLVQSIEGDRNRDEAAYAAWHRRHESNVNWIGNVIVKALKAEGGLHRSWTIQAAASFLVMLFSLRNWDDLIHGSGWTTTQYVETLTATAMTAMAGPAKLPGRARRQAIPTDAAAQPQAASKRAQKSSGISAPQSPTTKKP